MGRFSGKKMSDEEAGMREEAYDLRVDLEKEIKLNDTAEFLLGYDDKFSAALDETGKVLRNAQELSDLLYAIDRSKKSIIWVSWAKKINALSESLPQLAKIRNRLADALQYGNNSGARQALDDLGGIVENLEQTGEHSA